MPATKAQQIGHLPAVGVLFVAFLGYNPVQHLLGGSLGGLPPDQASFLTGHSFFPSLITQRPAGARRLGGDGRGPRCRILTGSWRTDNDRPLAADRIGRSDRPTL